MNVTYQLNGTIFLPHQTMYALRLTWLCFAYVQHVLDVAPFPAFLLLLYFAEEEQRSPQPIFRPLTVLLFVEWGQAVIVFILIKNAIALPLDLWLFKLSPKDKSPTWMGFPCSHNKHTIAATYNNGGRANVQKGHVEWLIIYMILWWLVMH